MTSTSLQITVANSLEMPAPAGHYSHVCSAGGFAYISGQLPITHEGKVLACRPFIEQVRQVLDNLDACLRHVDLGRNALVQVRVYVTDMAQWPEFNAIYADWIGEHRPARAVASVSELHYGASIEVEAVAVLPREP